MKLFKKTEDKASKYKDCDECGSVTLATKLQEVTIFSNDPYSYNEKYYCKSCEVPYTSKTVIFKGDPVVCDIKYFLLTNKEIEVTEEGKEIKQK